MSSVSWRTRVDLKWFIFLVLTEIILNLLHRQHVIMILLMDWQITKGHQWQPDLIGILPAVTKQKCTVSNPIVGTTLLIILLARKYLYFIISFWVYSTAYRSQRYALYSVASTNQAAFFIGGRQLGEVKLYSSVIAKYENNDWYLHGNLRTNRGCHRSITFGTEILVIGGKTDDHS